MWQRQAVRHGGKFLKHIIPAIIKPLHALWNEVIGFLFLSFAVAFGFKTFYAFRAFSLAAPEASSRPFWEVVLCGGVALLMAYYGISSFLRARKISRS